MDDVFIKTSDSDTADKLIKLGFKLLNKSGGVYTFLNNKNAAFSAASSNAVYSDVLTI